MAAYVHRLIKKTAVEFAQTFYEDAAHDNDFYKMYPDAKTFARRQWKYFIEPVRQTFVHMLTTEMPEAAKEEIAEALILNQQLPNIYGLPRTLN
jgi:hypothetical protein